MFTGLLIGMEGWYSTKCRLTWKIKGTKYSRFYCQLAVSTHHTNDTESGLLLTPSLVQIAETPEEYQERQTKRTQEGKNQTPHPNNKYNCLLSQILYSGMLPTPKVGGQGNSHQRMKEGRIDDLTTMARFGMLPTPATQNYKGASSIEALQKRGRLKAKADNLADQFAVNGKTSQLSPQFVMEMMGFPIDWTLLPFLNGETNQSKQEEMR
jgi:hypothetical protein